MDITFPTLKGSRTNLGLFMETMRAPLTMLWMMTSVNQERNGSGLRLKLFFLNFRSAIIDINVSDVF